ncbi:MAG: RagB/SusD family nutrient uptake outer membrane protein [Prevotella sp.]|nr:RagB/SusD family nutrient uptake outer membrane protein [Prevotella sp.]
MITKNIKHTLIAGVACCIFGATFTSCAEDFLDQTNTYALNRDTYFDTEQAVISAMIPLYNYVWYDFNDKGYYGMGDGRANNITASYSDYIYPYANFTEQGISAGLSEAWRALYSVVSQSNSIIRSIEASNLESEAKSRYKAEARFMRGIAYWYIASLWGVGIIYENSEEMVDNYVVNPCPQTDVMEYAIRDLEYAANYLPASSPGDGRVTKYAAYGMLSRVYLSMAGLTTNGSYDGNNIQTEFNSRTRNEYYLDLAKKAAQKVIDESGARLLDDYAQLFHYATQNNNQEVLFQLQFMPGSSVDGAAQSITRFFGWSAMVAESGPGGQPWGGATYCSWDLWKEFKQYEDKTLGITVDDAVRRHNSVASYKEVYPEFSTDPNAPYIYGVTESRGNQGANIKKYVTGNSKVNGVSTANNSAVNTYMLRLAEVYLNYAEAVLGNNATTTDAEALDKFNAIRRRAGVPVKSQIGWEDLRHEFRVEFAFEGLYWYQLLRRSYYQRQEVLNYMNNDQQRNAHYDINTATEEYEISTDYKGDGVSTATTNSFQLPVPDVDKTKNPGLKTDADGNYTTRRWEFGQREVETSELY